MKNKLLTWQILAMTLLIPVAGFSHALLVSPAPRAVGNNANAADIINTAGNEVGPCDPNLQPVPCASTSNPSLCTFAAGQSIPVTFEAVIQHAGPFTLSLGPAASTSATAQASFTTLMSPVTLPTSPFVQTESQNADGTYTEVQKADVSAATPDVYKEYVVIPANTTPGNYTLQLQQADAPVTYYTCADITITAAGTSPSPTPSVTPTMTGTPGGGGPIGAQGLGNNPTAQNGQAKMASCGSVHDISGGPGRGPGSALMIFVPLLFMLLLRLRANQGEAVRVRARDFLRRR